MPDGRSEGQGEMREEGRGPAQTAAAAAPGPLAALTERLCAAGAEARAPAVMAAIRHLHRLVDEVLPTPEMLREALEFLTEVGHRADHRRQEWVLLADVLGVSTRVEELAHPCPAGATPATLPGPFYRPDAPEMPLGACLSLDGRGEPLEVRGRVRVLGAGPAAGAIVEVWHANGEGRYENQEPDLQPEFNLRGRFRADAEGRFWFRTIRPRGYRLPEDGPVGRLMNGLGLPLERPAHLHFRVAAAGCRTLVTSVFDRDDPAIGRDALFGVKPELLAAFQPAPGGGWAVEVELVLAPMAAESGI